jgi:hypothetical protein
MLENRPLTGLGSMVEKREEWPILPLRSDTPADVLEKKMAAASRQPRSAASFGSMK